MAQNVLPLCIVLLRESAGNTAPENRRLAAQLMEGLGSHKEIKDASQEMRRTYAPRGTVPSRGSQKWTLPQSWRSLHRTENKGGAPANFPLLESTMGSVARSPHEWKSMTRAHDRVVEVATPETGAERCPLELTVQ